MWHIGHWEQLNQVNGAGYQCTIRGPQLMHSIRLCSTLSSHIRAGLELGWSRCAGAVDKNSVCHIWLKQSLMDPIALSPRLLIKFPSSRATCRRSWSNTTSWPHQPAWSHYLTCFLCGGVKHSVKLREKHYTCPLEQAGATDRLKRKGIDLSRVKVGAQLTSGDKYKKHWKYHEFYRSGSV